MWDQFLIALLLGIIFIFLPGFLFLRSCNQTRFTSLALSPLLAILLFTILGIIYSKIGIASSWITVFGAVFAISILLYIVSFLVRKKLTIHSADRVVDSMPKYYLPLYLGISFTLGSVFFLANLSSADAFFQAYDNIFHLGVIQGFIESGNWSILEVSLYETATFEPPLPANGSFYPAAWHILCALLVSALNVPITLSVNTVNFIFSFVVFPIGMLYLFKTIFKDNHILISLGSLCSFAFAGFPWGLLTFGPLYPNLTSFALLPLLIAVFIRMTCEKQAVLQRLSLLVIFVVGLGSIAVTQPNAAFTLGVFLVPFCIYSIFISSKKRFGSPIKATLLAIGFTLFVCAFWWFLYNAPFMQATLSQLYPKYYTKPEAIFNLLTLWFRDSAPNAFLGVVVVIGCLYSLKNRQFLWLVFSYAIAGAFYLVNASCVDVSFVKNLLTGFWYSDIYRIEAMLALFGAPIATLGIYAIYDFAATRLISKILPNNNHTKSLRITFLSIVVIAAVLFYAPVSEPIETQFGKVSSNISEDYGISSDSILTTEEKEFIYETKEIIGDCLVINLPDDGSAFAYPIANLNTYYRNTRTYDVSSESEESSIIRENLDEVSTNPEVRNSVQTIEADYLLLLDQGTTNNMPCLFTWDFYSYLWSGLTEINDQTPGLVVILSEGDMRLYKILW